ncbi:MAG: hypothetical protein KC910_04015 [Candidatus Eremiobacteraeota bacterium]|nr:hypothetical protein [Candidatus Eremiobacteraeota bacterium]
MCILGKGLAAPSQVTGVVLSVEGQKVTLHTADGASLQLVVSKTPPNLQAGDIVDVLSGSKLTVRPSAPSPGSGRIYAVDPTRKVIAVDTSRGRVELSVVPATVVFKEHRATSWRNLHRGETVVFVPQGGTQNGPVLILYDTTSYAIRLLSPTHGSLLAWGEVTRVEREPGGLDGSLTLENLEGETVTVRFDQQTRWRLGARFKEPADFQDVESLVFGPNKNQVRLVLSRRAARFVLDSALTP